MIEEVSKYFVDEKFSPVKSQVQINYIKIFLVTKI